jgi:hypothetical protein
VCDGAAARWGGTKTNRASHLRVGGHARD